MASTRRIESKDCPNLVSMTLSDFYGAESESAWERIQFFGFVLVVTVHGLTLADVTTYKFASLLREWVNTGSVLATTKLPLSKWPRLKFGNNKTMSIIFPTACLQPQQMCDINLCFANEENVLCCAYMASQSDPVNARVTRGSATVPLSTCHAALIEENLGQIVIYSTGNCLHQYYEQHILTYSSNIKALRLIV